METVSYSMQVPKEGKEIVDLLDGILEKVLAKAEIASYMSLVGDLTKAADGIASVKDEVKSEYRDELAAYMVHKLMARLLPVEDEQPPAA